MRCAAGIGLGNAIKYLRLLTSGAAGNGLCTKIKYLRSAVGIDLGTTAEYLRRTTSPEAGNGLGTTAEYLVNQNTGAGKTWAKGHSKGPGTLLFLKKSPCIVAAFVVNSEPYAGVNTEAFSAAHLSVGPSLLAVFIKKET
jgi:hypothetical protein